MLKYLTKKNTTFWYRRRIHKNKEIVFSLKTKDYNEALLRHSFINYEINYLFARGIKYMTDIEIKNIVDKYKIYMIEKSVNKYSRQRDKELATYANGNYYGGHTKEALQIEIDKYKRVHISDDYDLVQAVTTKVLNRSNIKEEFEKLTDEDDIYNFHYALLKAEWDLLYKAKIFQETLPNNKQTTSNEDSYQNKNSTPVENQNYKKYRISELFNLYIKEESIRKEWGERNERDLNLVFKHFISYYNDSYIDELNREHFSYFRNDVISKLPIKITKNIYKNKSTKEIILIAKKEKDERIQKGTINKYVRRLHQVFEWATNTDKINKNLTKELQLKEKKNKKDKKLPYSKNDLKNLFSKSPWFNEDLKDTLRHNPQYIFIPLLCLYNGGAKPTELAQLYTDDIKKYKGLWVIDFNNEDDKNLKDDYYNSRRVPLSQKIIDIGFLDYVKYIKKKKSKKLFPSISIFKSGGTNFTNKFSEYNKKYITTAENKTFYSLRHLVNQVLKNNKIKVYIINDITGHSYASENKDNSVYGDTQMPERIMKEVIDKCLTFDYIDLSHIQKVINEIY